MELLCAVLQGMPSTVAPAVCQPDEDTPYGNAGILPRPVNEEVYPVCYFPGKGK